MEIRQRAGGSMTRSANRLAWAVLSVSVVWSSLRGAPALGASSATETQQTALDVYVAKPDPAYRFSRASVIAGDGYTAHVLDLVSQQWRNPWEVDRTEWRHWLTIIVPDQVRHTTALLWIGGGDNDDPAPLRAPDRSVRLALSTGSVVADLGMVPNQPLYFTDSPKQGRFEDDLIGHARVKYIVTGDVEWLVRLAMVKSAVRAMDAVQEYLDGDGGGHVEIEDFVVAGGSKRGWTTWLVGAVDPRVAAIVPVVIDALNSEAITRHHFEAYGFFSPALGDYVRHGLYPYLLGSEALDRILAVEDPYRYRERERLRSIPKLMVNAAGDQFFLPDNSRFYFADLQGEKHLRYVPNAKHDLVGSDAQDTILAFYGDILARRGRPRFSWQTLEDETIVVTAEDPPREVRLWQASNPTARDFRLDVIGKAWTSTVLQSKVPGEFRARVPPPARGYTAFFVELTYGGGEGGGAASAEVGDGSVTSSAGARRQPNPALKLTTTVSVVPNRLPYSLDIENHTGPWLGGP